MIDTFYGKLINLYGRLMTKDRELMNQEKVLEQRFLAAIDLSDTKKAKELNKEWEKAEEKRSMYETILSFLELILDRYFA